MLIFFFLLKYLLENILKRNLEKTKKYLERELTLEARKDTYKSELAIRQINATEEIWSLFTVTSLSNIGNNIVNYKSENHYYFIKDNAIEFVENFNKTFSTKAGLYIDKDTREALYNFRNYIKEQMIEEYNKTSDRKLNEQQVKEYKRLRTDARLKLRNQVGSFDLTIGHDEFNSKV